MTVESEPSISDTNQKGVISNDFNPDEYRHHLESLNLTKEQEDEILTALYHIMSTFVQIGWGVENVQYFLPDLFENVSKE